MAGGSSSYVERAPTPALAPFAVSVWIQQVGDQTLAQRHESHGGGGAPRLLGPLTTSTVAAQQIPAFKTAELYAALAGAAGGFDAVSPRIGTVWGPLGLPDNPFFALPRLLSATVRGEDPGPTPPRPTAHTGDATDLGRGPGRPTDNHLDIGRLREDTGFQPEYDVERSVADYADGLAYHDR